MGLYQMGINKKNNNIRDFKPLWRQKLMRKLICYVGIICVLCIFPTICSAAPYIRVHTGQGNQEILNIMYFVKVVLDKNKIRFIGNSETTNVVVNYDTIEMAEREYITIFKELNGIQDEN